MTHFKYSGESSFEWRTRKGAEKVFSSLAKWGLYFPSLSSSMLRPDYLFIYYRYYNKFVVEIN